MSKMPEKQRWTAYVVLPSHHFDVSRPVAFTIAA